MRVVLDGRIILPRMTGAGRYVLELARRMPTVDPDLDLHLLVLPAFQSTQVIQALEEAGVQLHYCRAPIAGVRQWIEIPPVLRRLRPDLYHYPFLDLPLVHCPAVITVYDLNPVLYPAYFDRQRALRRAVGRWLVRSSLRRCRLALPISETTRGELEAFAPSSHGKTRVVPLGVAEDFWSTAERTDAAVTSWVDAPPWGGRPYVLYVGVDRPHKNLVTLVQAVAAWRAAEHWSGGEGPYLWLAGVGEGSVRLRDEIRRLGCCRDVRRGAPVEESALAEVYRHSRVVVYVSISEGFGLPLLEAFASRVPVLCSNAAALLEIGGDAAYYVPAQVPSAIAEGLGRLWGDRGLRDSLVARGADRLRAFSWDRTARGTLAAYSEALD